MKTRSNLLTIGMLLATSIAGLAQTAVIRFSSTNYSVSENGGSATIAVLRTGDTSGTVTVDYATSDGTATAGVDYTARSGTLTFAAGETSNTFIIPILDDGLVEGDETVKLGLSSPSGVAILSSPSTAVLTIRDNERPVRLDSSFDPGTGATGVRPFVFSVKAQPDGKVMVAGDFDSINGVSRNGIARLNADGSLDTSFDPGSGAGGSDPYKISCVVIQADGRILAGGDFSTFNGQSRSGIVRLNSDGTVDNTFNPGPVIIGSSANAGVRSILVQSDEKILVGGYFTSVNGTSP